MEIRKIRPLSFAKIQTILMTIFGVILGLFELIVTFIYGYEFFPSMYTISITGRMGAFAIILLPILYALIGFILGFFGGLIYNFIAKHSGGIEVEFVDKSEKPVKEKKQKK